MIKLSYRWVLPLLLLQSVASVASAEVLLKVVSSSPSTPSDSYSTTCSITPNTVVIDRNTNLWQSTDFSAREIRAVRVSAVKLRNVIAQAAQGTISGNPIVGGGTYRYMAYQKQADGSVKEILLLDKKGGMSNDSIRVIPLTKFMDNLCGNIAQ